MKQRELEMKLQKIPPHPSPKPGLEQYATPARVAADILYLAHTMGDVEERSVLDLGCGTGVFAIGAALLGASQVLGIDIDKNALTFACRAGRELGVEIEFSVADLAGPEASIGKRFDTAIMNPPFGAQKKGAFKPFLEKALAHASVTYMLHQKKNRDYIARLADENGGQVSLEKDYRFEIRHMFKFHRKEKENIETTLFRIESTEKPRDLRKP